MDKLRLIKNGLLEYKVQRYTFDTMYTTTGKHKFNYRWEDDSTYDNVSDAKARLKEIRDYKIQEKELKRLQEKIEVIESDEVDDMNIKYYPGNKE
jgi:hypothetical protein